MCNLLTIVQQQPDIKIEQFWISSNMNWKQKLVIWLLLVSSIG